MKKYAHSLLRYFVIYALGFIPFYIVSVLSNVLYGILSDKLPSLFPSYNALTDKAQYVSLEATLALLCAVITVFITTAFAVKYDNERYEFIIDETDGFYTLRDGGKIYAKSYLYADAVCALCVPIVFFILTYVTFPEDSVRALRILEDVLVTVASPTNAFSNKLGLELGVATAVFTSLLSRIPAGYMGLKRWRGLWLSDIDG